MTGWWAVVSLAALVLVILLEGKRQERALGERASGKPNVLGSALLEIQGLLEADRKVDEIQEVLQNRDRVEGEHDQRMGDDAGDRVSYPDRRPRR